MSSLPMSAGSIPMLRIAVSSYTPADVSGGRRMRRERPRPRARARHQATSPRAQAVDSGLGETADHVFRYNPETSRFIVSVPTTARTKTWAPRVQAPTRVCESEVDLGAQLEQARAENIRRTKPVRTVRGVDEQNRAGVE